MPKRKHGPLIPTDRPTVRVPGRKRTPAWTSKPDPNNSERRARLKMWFGVRVGLGCVLSNAETLAVLKLLPDSWSKEDPR